MSENKRNEIRAPSYQCGQEGNAFMRRQKSENIDLSQNITTQEDIQNKGLFIASFLNAIVLINVLVSPNCTQVHYLIIQ